jgi:nicotinamidase-related amidase
MLKPKTTGLMVVDVQGKLARIVQDSDAVIRNISLLIQGARILELPIIWLEQNPDRLGPTVEELQPVLQPGCPIPKMTFDGCGAPDCVRAIRESGRTQWLICGIETHICVYQTAMSLLGMGHKVELVTDCVSSRSQANTDLAVAKMAGNGVGMTSLEMCLYELLGDCRAQEFKDILRLIK